jgi:hypothetical protein
MESFQSFPKAKGGRELKKHLAGERLTQRQMILAKCYDCMGNYFDGRIDCDIEDCPLYPLQPYGKGSFRVPKGTRKPLQRLNPKTKAILPLPDQIKGEKHDGGSIRG